uniref:Putative glycosyl transferase, family 14 n=1 Tax=Helianthus annuus TaxID=4232 RepID=A0A251SM02_HELAN
MIKLTVNAFFTTLTDLLHTLSTVPRELNFIEHTSDIGWKEYQRAKPVIIDPGLYSNKKSDVFWVSQKRSVPTAYKLFTGSAWMMLSRSFVEYCLWGWDNLPRIVLMYYANFLSSPEGYFHTVICNADEFKNTTVNHDLHFISWDNPPKQHPHFLSIDDYERMVESHAPFARKFGADKELLDKIDSELLGREPDGFVTSNWLDKSDANKTIAESIVRNATELKPGPGAERIKTLIGDLLHTLSTVPRELNFIEHTSDIGWKEYQRAKPVIIDPGLYSNKKSDVFWVSQKRSVPTAYKLFTGSAWMMLSRSFVEYCLWGWDNLPRIVLMYYANFLSSPEGYFHTVICNADEFKNTTVNHDLHFISWDNPPKQHPHFLSIDDYERMVESHAPFARKFGADKELLDKIDSELLGREPDGFVTSNWLDKSDANKTIAESIVRNATELKPGPGAERIKTLIGGMLSDKDFHLKHCI